MKPKSSSVSPIYPDYKRLGKISGTLALTLAATGLVEASTDYGPAGWYACCNYTVSGNGKKFYVEHDMEGYFWPSIYYLARCSTSASIHYSVNGKKDTSSDSAGGHIVQSVRDAYYAWHARCWNHYSMGTEHEGFASNPAWYTEAMYQASGSLTRSKCTKYGISKDRNRVIGHDQKRISSWVSWMQAIGYSYSFATCNTHHDPGPYWNWSHFMDIVRGGGATPSGPSSLVASTYSASQIKLTWVDNSSIESGFKIERSTSSTSGFAQIATVGANVRAYTAGSLASGTRYYFRVRAYNAYGNSPYSNTANAVTKDTIPAAPTSLTATAVSDVQINLAWAQSMPNEDGFRIYRSTDGTNFTQVATAGINATSYANTGLAGNRKYYYKVYAYNTAGNSAASNVASDTTAPQAPSGLAVAAVAGTTNWNKLQLTWTDNSAAEVGFKVERGTAAAGPFTQIATTAAGVANYQDSGLAASTTYYYRVRSYNANGNSTYSAVVSKATPNAPPVLSAIGDKTVAAGATLAFTATASDPNAPAASTAWTATWEGNANGDEEIMFRKPSDSGSTSQFVNSAVTNYSTVHTGAPAGVGGTKAVKASWSFKTGFSNYWIRYNTFNAPSFPNPTIQLDQTVRFRMYPSKAVKVGIIVRETGTTAAYGANGGTTGTLEYVGVTNVVGGVPIPNRQLNTTNWNTVTMNIPFESQMAFTGDGKVDQSGAKGVLDAIIVTGAGGTGSYYTWLDDLSIIISNYKTYTLDAGAPAGATIGRRNGKFSWTPTTAQVGVFPITIRVTDNLGGQDYETIRVTVTGTGNAAPTLAAIGAKSVNEGSTLAFTATASDANGNALTFSLDAGAPAGASITTAGAFSWTPTEAQGPGSYPITVRVTDNGSPSSNDFETITVTVNEVNNAPVINAIADQTISEGQTLNVTASASDSDVPANSLTYSVAGPVGMTINASSGAISWTPTESDAGDVDQVVVTVKDNGNPAKTASTTFNVTVNAVNSAPVVTIGSISDLNPFAPFDELDDEGVEGHNNSTGFRVPYFSATTTQYLDSTSYSYVTNVFPQDDLNGSYQALYVNMNFKTGTTSPWCRLSTFTSSTWTNTYAYPNPTIDLGQHVRVKIWTDRAIKVALGVRETGTGNPLGFDGGTTGAIEWLGATTITNGSVVSPVPTRTITASNWTQLDFNLPAETIKPFPGSGNGVLATGKGVLEHLAIVPNGGSGFYNIYIDDLETMAVKSGGSITANTLDTLSFKATATDTDLPAQDIAFSLAAGPTNAVLDDASGAFLWTVQPDQTGANVITVTATDNGTPALSGSASVTVNVAKVNTPPRIEKMQDQVVENGGGQTITFDAAAQDDDLPGDTLTFSLTAAPAGATISATTGTFTWTPPSGGSTNLVTIRVTDNGSPSLWDEQTVRIIVAPANTAPILSLGTARAAESVVSYETFTNNTPNEQVMFKKPGNSSTTTNFVDLALTNYTTVTTAFPAGTGHGSKVLKAGWTFKTGQANYWVRLTTANTTLLPNPTINASARLKFDVYCDKQIKVALGIRETGTTAENGANGGTTGTIEFVGATGKQANGAPIPSRTVNANVWTTLEFDLPNEPKQAFTGDAILNGGQQVLEHLALVGTTTGAHTLYLDNFEVVTTAALPGTVTMKANSTLTFTATATDPDPGAGVIFGIDADFAEAHTNATINETTGAFSWTPVTADAGTTNSLTVTANDDPTNGGIPKSDSKSLTIIVNSDTLGAQSGNAGTFVAGGDTVTLTWDSTAGASYSVQSKAVGAFSWNDSQTVTATGSSSSVSVTNDGADAYYRIVETGASDQ